MKNFLFFLLILIVGFQALTKRLTVLKEVEKPYYMRMDKWQILISDETSKVHLYNLKDFKYWQVGKKGNGPGEYPLMPRTYFTDDHIFIYRRGKCMYFNREGKYIREFKIKSMRTRSFRPFGSDFLLEKSEYNKSSTRDMHTEFTLVSRTEENTLKYKKLLYYQESKNEIIKNNKRPVNLVLSYFDYEVYRDKLFVHDNTIGFYVEVYDREGNQINKINIPYEKQKVPNNYPDKLVNKMKQRGHWEIFKNSFYFDLPEYFPAFYRFAVDNDKLYFLTYNEKDGKRELVVADFNGKILNKLFVPYFSEEMHTYFAIRNDKFYYIKENEDEEQWELHVENIQ